ncbi:MAG: family 16 glycosylhydrolase [Acholeplasmataceae bacterium]
MKKIANFVLLIILSVALIACESNGEEPTPSGVPNGLEPILPIAGCDEPTLEGGWVCIWADEFDGPEIDETKWTFEIDGRGGGNNELQYYRRENAFIEDGKLIIEARREDYMNKLYTSARLNSKYKGDFQYVRVVVSAQMAGGRGTWPAIWMLPTMNAYGIWPNSGEIDIMEYVGYDPDRVHATIHTRRFNHNLGTQLGRARDLDNAETEHHTYELIWGPGDMRFLVNGNQYFQAGYNAALNTDVPYHHAFPFDQLFHLVLNVAVGGNWGGAQGVDPNIFPTSMSIDYVRVYQLDYATLDIESPSEPLFIQPAQLANTIWWRASTDDIGVEKYAIYIDGELYDHASLNQYTFSRLTKGQTYEIQVQAVDFVGRTSPKSETALFTYE